MIPLAHNVWQPISAAIPAALARRRSAEQPALAVLGDAGRIDVGAQRFGKRMMTRHRMFLAAFSCSRTVHPAPRGCNSKLWLITDMVRVIEDWEAARSAKISGDMLIR